MPRGRPHKTVLNVSASDRDQLLRWSKRPKSSHALAQRASIILRCADGHPSSQVAHDLRLTNATVWKWRKRFVERGLAGLLDEPRAGAPRTLSDEKVEEVVTATLETMPQDATHWSTRSLAARTGISNASVSRIWHAFALQPHRVETFKLSNDPQFIEKVRDIVGLYLNPPDRALVLCVDEKSQIQALDRTQPRLPMKKGRCGTMTHDYRRHGTTTLFAALSTLDGKVIGDCMPRHRHQEFIRFLEKIDAETPSELDLHLIVDNYGTHKHPQVQSWIRRHPRFHLHFVPTSSSWLNMVERWFREITDQRIRRGSFRSVPELITAINDYLDHHNQNPRVFAWTASVERIMSKVAKCKEALGTLH